LNNLAGVGRRHRVTAISSAGIKNAKSRRPLASPQGLDEAERVIYIGTFNKALFPGLRLGYAVVPGSLVRAFVTARCLMDRQPPSLCQAILTALMEEGHFAAHIRRMREL
jgi:GntR family transcriptional regulator / MocR family aminotransferase